MSVSHTSEPNPLVRGSPAPAFPAFRARWPWLGGDLQTVRNTITHRAPDFSPYPAERLILPLADGDRLWALLNRPGRDSAKPLIVLVHGLTGSEDSRNIKTSAAYHLQRGYPVLRLNLRGAGPSRGQGPHHYHAGRSADLREAVAALPPPLKSSGLLLVGVSLGGNVCLKLLGENIGTGDIIAAATVCAPIDLKMAQLRIGARRNAVYERHLLRSMCADARARGTPEEVLARVHTVYDFDDLVVAPNNGFQNAEDYYRQSSAGPFIDAIQIPTLLIHTRTDPWVPARMYLERTWKDGGAATLLMSPGGGHVGFHAADSAQPWHDRCIGIFFDDVVGRRR